MKKSKFPSEVQQKLKEGWILVCESKGIIVLRLEDKRLLWDCEAKKFISWTIL